MSYDRLFQPLDVNGCTIPNRIVRTAHSTDEVVARGNGNDLLRTYPADTVVLVSYRRPDDDLFDALCETPLRVHRVGDVTGTDTIQAAVHGAAAIARAL